MCWIAGQAKHFAREIESDDAPTAVLIGSATSDGALDDEVDVIRGVSLTDDHRIAAVTDRSAPKRENAVLYNAMIAPMQKHF